MPPLIRARVRSGALLGLVWGAALGCTGDPPPAPPARSAPETAADAATVAPASAPAPRAGPRRIVSLSPLTTRMLVDLGAGDRIVGRADHDTVPLPAPGPGQGPPVRVGDPTAPSLAAVRAAAPDLVVGLGGPAADAVFLAAKSEGLAFVALRADGLADVPQSWARIGLALGAPEAGRARGDAFIAQVEAAVVHPPAEPPLPAVVVHQHTPLLVAGPGSYGHDLLAVNGAENVAQAAPAMLAHWPDALLMAANPSVILDFSPQRDDPAAVAALRARFSALPALAAGRLHAAPRAVIAADLDAPADVAWVNRALFAPPGPAAAPQP